MDNNFNNLSLVQLIYKWKWHIIIITLVAPSTSHPKSFLKTRKNCKFLAIFLKTARNCL